MATTVTNANASLWQTFTVGERAPGNRGVVTSIEPTPVHVTPAHVEIVFGHNHHRLVLRVTNNVTVK